MRTDTGVKAALAFTLLLASPAAAQEHEHGDMMMPTEGVRAALIHDIEGVESKVVSLAEAMTDHWAWRPGEGVRSVGEVYGHIAGANMMIPMFAGIEAPEMYRGADQGETMANLGALEQKGPDELMEELRHSFMHARHAIARIPDDRLDDKVQFFGQEGTIGDLLVLYVTHMHEHLGQSIAYARTNGVVPPWSRGGM